MPTAAQILGSALEGAADLGTGALRLGVGAARVGLQGAAFGASAAWTAAETAASIGRTGLRAGRFLGGGRLVHWEEAGHLIPPNAARSWLPKGLALREPKLAALPQALLAGGAVAAAVAGGGHDAFQQGRPSKGWEITRSAVNGQLEIENPHFLGATGSLTLALYRNRYGRAGMPYMDGVASRYEMGVHGMAHLTDDLAMAALRVR